MFGFLEKWALKRLLKRVVDNMPQAKEKVSEAWEEHKDEIVKKVEKAIKTAVVKIIYDALAKKGNKVPDAFNN